MLLLAADVDSVSAQVGPTGTIVEFDYTLANVSPTGFSPRVVVSTGVIDTGSSVELPVRRAEESAIPHQRVDSYSNRYRDAERHDH
jgi:hypothetical protein